MAAETPESRTVRPAGAYEAKSVASTFLAAAALVAALAVPLADTSDGLVVEALADGHPPAVVLEVVDPDPEVLAETLAWLGDFDALGVPHTGGGPGWTGSAGEARILMHPAGPVPMETLERLGEEVRRRPSVRWTLAPSERTWGSRQGFRAAVGLVLATLAGLLMVLGGLRSAPRLAAALTGAAACAWMMQPLAPVALAFLPLATAAGWVASSSRVPWVALAGLPLLATGHPHLQTVGAMLLGAGTLGSVLAWVRPGETTPLRSAGDARSGWLAVGLAALLGVAAGLAPAAPLEALMTSIPRSATVDALDAPALDALQAHGLGTIDGPHVPSGSDAVLAEHQRRLAGRHVLPLVGPWVEEAFADTLMAEAPDARLSLPTQAPAVVPWLAVAVWGVLWVGLGLVAHSDGRIAVARLLPSVAVIPALAWAGAGAGPEGLAVAVALGPGLAVLVAHPSPLGALERGGLIALPAMALALGGLFDLASSLLAAALLASLLHRAAPAVASGAWPSPGVRRWGARAAFGALLLLHLDVLVLLLVSFQPPLPGVPPAGEPMRDGRALVLGEHRLHREHGVFVLSTQGDPYEAGYAAAHLANPLRERLEDELFEAYSANVPSGMARWLISRGSAVAGWGLDAELKPEHRVELRGDIDAAPERFAFAGPSYTRKVYYHAIHDIGQALVDTPLLGCTGFVAGPPMTPDGHWRVGRAFDFDGGVAFDRDKVLRVHQPDDGYAYLSVAFAGIVGAVSGVNEEGIAVVINASGSDDLPRPGTPMTLIVREILQSASSLVEARDILEARTGFVSENVLVVDADAGEAALFEVSPARVAQLDVDEWLAFSNHFRTEAFADHEENLRRMAELTSVPRLQRAEELVSREVGTLDQRAAARILSDREGLGDAPLPRGHRHALNADIATHGVVIDATTRSLWVSVYPNLAGGWVSLSLSDAREGRLSPVREVPGDRNAWRAVEIRTARELLRASRRSRSRRAHQLAERALAIWPDHPEALLEAGLARERVGAPGGLELLQRAERARLEYPHQQRSLDAARAKAP